MDKLLEISKWSNKMIEWQTGLYINKTRMEKIFSSSAGIQGLPKTKEGK